jgi:hypothetical protein
MNEEEEQQLRKREEERRAREGMGEAILYRGRHIDRWYVGSEWR